MEAVFGQRYDGDNEDKELVTLAKAGDSLALEKLIEKNQVWIYNVALRMVGRPEDAEDVTQEVLVKVVTKLSTFEGRSSFRTWLYRIVANHTLNMKRKLWERLDDSFEKHAKLVDGLEVMDPGNSIDDEILADGVKTACMTGMLLCLDRQQRLVMILGSIFGVDSQFGATILEISPENFRQILSRARKQLKSFMAEKCGLLDERNPCRCPAKTRAAIQKGLVNPDNLQFYHRSLHRVHEFVSDNLTLVDDALELKVEDLFREHPLQPSPDFATRIRKIMKYKPFVRFVEFDDVLPVAYHPSSPGEVKRGRVQDDR
jgi:RNA polymerase sigma factor (sigma-70 family)